MIGKKIVIDYIRFELLLRIYKIFRKQMGKRIDGNEENEQNEVKKKRLIDTQ